MPNILDLSARLSADIRPFVTSMGSSAQSSRTTFQSIAQVATMYLGARGLLGTLNRANQAAMAFGQSLADASAISTLSVKELGDSLKSLDNVFGSVSKASQSMYRILSSGFSQLSADQLVEFQKAVGVSAKVIRADLYNTADVMTTIANAYQLNIDQIKKLQDWFYITVREGKAQGQDLARTLGLVINSASEAGVSLNELGAAIAVLSRTQSVSQSMIGLNQMLNAFIKPTLQAQAAARKWGIEISATALQEKGLTAILTELNQKVGGNVEALEKMFGNIRAGRAILSLTGKQFHNYLNVVNMYNTEAGSGMKAFEKQIDTVQNAYERLQAQQEKTLIDVGEDWADLRKIVYNTGEVLLKAFSDSSGVSRWSVYLYGINLAVKNIVGTVSMLRDSINGTTRSVEKLANAMARAAKHSNAARGISPIYGPYKDSWDSYNKMYKAMFALTGFGTGKNKLEIMANKFLHGHMYGIGDKINPNPTIASVMLNPQNPAHQAKARKIATERVLKQYTPYKPAAFDKNGNPTDYYLVHPLSGQNVHKLGGRYYRDPITMNQAVAYQERLVYLQSLTTAQDMRKAYNDSVKAHNQAKRELENAAKLRKQRMDAFRAMPKGERVNTLSPLTSRQRLIRMKEHQGVIGYGGFSNLNAAFQYGGFGYGMKNIAKGIGQSIGTAFSTVATLSFGASLLEMAVRFGMKAGEAMGLADKFAKPVVDAANAKRSVAITDMFNMQVQKAAKTIREYEKATGKVSYFTMEQLAALQNQFRDLQLTNELESMEQAVSSLTEKIVKLRDEMGRKPVDVQQEVADLFKNPKLDNQEINNIMKYIGDTNIQLQKKSLQNTVDALSSVSAGRGQGMMSSNIEEEKQRLEKLKAGDISGLDKKTANAMVELQNALSDFTMEEFRAVVTNLTSDIESGKYKFDTDYTVNGKTLSKEIAKLFEYVEIPDYVYQIFSFGSEERNKKNGYIESINKVSRELMEQFNEFSSKLSDEDETTSLDYLVNMERLDERADDATALLNVIKHRKKKADAFFKEDEKMDTFLKEKLEERNRLLEFVSQETGVPIDEAIQDTDRAMESTLTEFRKKREKAQNDYNTIVVNTATRIAKYAKKTGNNIASLILSSDLTDVESIMDDFNNVLDTTIQNMQDAGLNTDEIADIKETITDAVHSAIFTNIKKQVQAELKSLDAQYNPDTMTKADYAKQYEAVADKYIGVLDAYSQIGVSEDYSGLKDILTTMKNKKLTAGKMSELQADLALLGHNVSTYDPKSEVGLAGIIEEYTREIDSITKDMEAVAPYSETYTKLQTKLTKLTKERNNYQQKLANIITNVDNNEEFTLGKARIEAMYELGELTYKEYTKAILELYSGLLDSIEGRLKDGSLDAAVREKLETKIPGIRVEMSKAEAEYMMNTLNEILEESLANIDLREAQHRLTHRQALRGQQGAYRAAQVSLANDILKYVGGDLGRRYNPLTGRMDGDRKTAGWRGIMSDKHGGIMSEVSRGVSIDGEEVEIPLIIPNSTKKDLDSIAKLVHGELTDEKEIKRLENKAIDFARKRLAEGKSPFYNGDKADRALRNVDLFANIDSLINDNVKLDSPEGKNFKKKWKEFVRQQVDIINEMADQTNEAREQLMNTLSGIISNNLERGRLTNFGMHHAMNLLARLSPRFKFDVGGASLGDVMRNARARYSGSTPDVSKAMTQQRRLSDMMDAYIVSKQYEDAGIGKNVQTIVTIMGKRLPLFLN